MGGTDLANKPARVMVALFFGNSRIFWALLHICAYLYRVCICVGKGVRWGNGWESLGKEGWGGMKLCGRKAGGDEGGSSGVPWGSNALTSPLPSLAIRTRPRLVLHPVAAGDACGPQGQKHMGLIRTLGLSQWLGRRHL
jgi:hypothetical protein